MNRNEKWQWNDREFWLIIYHFTCVKAKKTMNKVQGQIDINEDLNYLNFPYLALKDENI